MIQIQIATQTQIATQIQTVIQDSDAGKHTPVKPMSTTKDHHKAKALPETGNRNSGSNNATLFGGSLCAALGSLLLFGRRKKQNK